MVMIKAFIRRDEDGDPEVWVFTRSPSKAFYLGIEVAERLPDVPVFFDERVPSDYLKAVEAESVNELMDKLIDALDEVEAEK